MYFYLSYYLYVVLLFFTDYIIKKNLFIFLAILSIILISGTRFETGYDFFHYVGFYIGGADATHEPLFKLLLYILNLFTQEYQIFFFVSSLITIGFLYYAIKKYTKYKKTALLIFLLIPGLYLNTFSIVRQGIAEIFVMLAIYYLVYEKNRLKYLLYFVLSIGFHYTALVPLAIVFIFKKILSILYSNTIYILFIIFSLVLSKLNIADIILGAAFGRFAAYLDMTHDVSMLKLIVSNLFFILLVLFKNKFINSKPDVYLFNLMFIGILFINVFANFIPVTRFSYYFLIFQIILVPKLIYSFKSNEMKAIFLSGFIAYYSLMFTNSLIVDEKTDKYPKMTPYQNYFFKD